MDANPVIEMLGRPLRLAVVGGGPGSFIGAMHRTAARLDGRYALVAGVVSSDPERSRVAAHSDAAEAIAARRSGRAPDPLALQFPNERDGAAGVRFVDAAVASSRANGAWTDARLSL